MIDERYRPPRDDVAGPSSTRTHASATEPATVTILQRRPHLFVTFGVCLLLLFAVVTLASKKAPSDFVTALVVLAVMAVDLLRWRRPRRLRGTKDSASIAAIDGERERTVARADVVVVTPSTWVTVALVLALLAVVRRNTTYGHVDPSSAVDVGEASAPRIELVLLASALWHRFSRRRVRLPGERWGRWFLRDDVARLFPEAFEAPPPEADDAEVADSKR